mmetsp:Transcript_24722/g.65907  ORF Transcript_24722/g.65907 Transcript_24722/m.65907 type:complete len:88 (-) Transcript_24722:36-299(-)
MNRMTSLTDFVEQSVANHTAMHQAQTRLMFPGAVLALRRPKQSAHGCDVDSYLIGTGEARKIGFACYSRDQLTTSRFEAVGHLTEDE